MEKVSNIENIKKELKKQSKGKGYISADSLNSIFEDDSITAEEIDEIYVFLKDNDIEVVSGDLTDMPEVKEEKKKKEKKSVDTTPIKTIDEIH